MAPIVDDREQLRALIARRSLIAGKFRLASGVESGVYFDMKASMLDPTGSRLLARMIVEIAQELGVDYLSGLALGAVPLVAAAAVVIGEAHLDLRVCYVRKQTKGRGTDRLIEGLAKGESLVGKSVAVLEDVTTSGGSALKAVVALRDGGAAVNDVISVVDRDAGARNALATEGLSLHALFSRQDFASV